MAIPETIKKLANDIRTKIYGKEVREALAEGIEEAGDLADKANTKSENAVYQVNNIQTQVNQLVVEGDSSVEAAQARVKADGTTFTTLKERLDDTDAQLADNTNKIGILSKTKGIAKTLKKLNNKEPVTIVCKGDSETYGYISGGTQSTNPYPKVLQEKLRYIYGYSNITVINSGSPGHTATNGLSNYQNTVLNYNPDLVIIMYGLNDSNLSTIDNFTSAIDEMCKKNSEIGAETILCSPNQAFLENYRNDIVEYSKRMKQLSIKHTTSFIDMFAEFEKINREIYTPLNMLGDDTHLKSDQYYIFADIILAYALFPYTTIVEDEDQIIVPSTSNNVFTVGNNKTKNNSYLTYATFNLLNTNPNDTIKVGFYVRKSGKYNLSVLHVSNGHATVNVEKNGAVLKEITGTKTAANGISDDMSFVAQLDFGFNFFEIKANSITDSSKYFGIEGFVVNKSYIETVLLRNTSATNDHTVEVLHKIYDEINVKSPSAVASGTGKFAYLPDKYLNLQDGKTLILDFEMKTDGYGGFGWFATKRYNYTFFDNGYYVYLGSTGISLWCASSKIAEYLTTLTPGQLYNIRVEHNATGEIKVYLDGALRLTVIDTKLTSGCFHFVMGDGTTYIKVKNVNVGYI